MAGILTSTAAPTQAPTQAPTFAPQVPKATQATFNPASASTYTSRDANASLATATGYDAAKQNVGSNSLVQNQLTGILSSGSPLLSMAQARADQQANQRGILNSSIAIGAGQKALYDTALPIAQQDASVYANKDVNDTAYENQARQFTAGAQNNASIQNANLGTQVNLANSSESNKAASQNAALATDVSKYNTGVGAQTSQFNSGAQNQFEQTAQQGAIQSSLAAQQGSIQERLANIQANTSLSIADKQAASQKALAEMDNANRIRLQQIQSDTTLSVADKQAQSQQIIAQGNNATNLAISGNDNETKKLLQSMDAATKLSMTNIDASTKLAIANLDASTKEKITQLEADNRELLQTNISASNMYAQYATNLANISGSDKMDAAAKQQAADNQLNALNAGLKAIGQVSGLDLSKYFQSATITNTSNTTTQPSTNTQQIDYGS